MVIVFKNVEFNLINLIRVGNRKYKEDMNRKRIWVESLKVKNN